MTITCRTVLYPVQDVVRATSVFATLFGTDPHVESPFYVGFSVDGHEIGLVPAGSGQELAGPTPFYDVGDIAAAIAGLVDVGAAVAQPPTDVGGGMLVAKVTDPDGNTLGLRQAPTGA